MKKLFLVCLSYLLLCTSLSAQSEKTVQEIANLLENADVFVKYRTFRSDFQKTNIDLGPKIKYYEDYEMLNIAYNDTQKKYNEFLEIIRRDLSDWSEIKAMGRNPGKFANKYLIEYNSVLDAYNDQFKPVYNTVLANSQLAAGKVISPQLVIVGVQIFNAVVDLIKNRKAEKVENLSLVIGTINSFFIQKLRMKSWAELDIPIPTAMRPVDTNGTSIETTTAVSADESEAVSIRQKEQTATVTQVSAPLFSTMSGFVEFHNLDNKDQDQKMNFTANRGKNIIVNTRKPQNGGIVITSQTNRVDYFTSVDAYAEGDQFYIKVNNTAGLYVIAQNSDGSVAVLYPYNPGKNIIIEGRDRNSVTTLPEADRQVTPPQQRYFTFEGGAEKESFCILLTRSDLDLQEVKAALEALPGEPLHDRLAKVFNDNLVQPAAANLQLDANRLGFDAMDNKATVLPVVFYISRK
jgi:hypothetical protein